MIEHFSQIYQYKPNPYGIAWSKQQDVLASTLTQLKQYFKGERGIFTLNIKPQKFVNQFTYIGSNILSTESDVNIRLVKVGTVFYRL